MEIITKASAYEFDTDIHGFPTFTEKNIAFLNGILRYDSNYSTASDHNNPEYQASYAGILEQGDFFAFSQAPSAEPDELGYPQDDLYRVIVSIDKINSTHLASEGNGKNDKAQGKRNKGRARVAQRLRQLGGEALKTQLAQKSDAPVQLIADASVGGKYNFSFASKFCTYVSLHALGQDNYCIYDEILRSVLPYYAYMYMDRALFEAEYRDIYYTVKGTKSNGNRSRNQSLVQQFKDNRDYAGYRRFIDRILAGIHAQVNPKVTYGDFDHMLWYYFKGSESKVQQAMDLLPCRKKEKA